VLLHHAHNLEPDNPTITYHLIVALDASARRSDALNLLPLNRAIGAKLLFLDALPPPAKASGRKSCPASAFFVA